MKALKNVGANLFTIGLIVFGVLFALALAFYRERVMNFDASFFAFLMIDTTDFSIALGRWGAVLAQVLPLYALKAGWSINTFLRLFSVAPIINYVLLFAFIHLYLKHYKASLLLLFSITLCFRHVFFYTTAELYFGMALCVLFYALVFPTDTSKRIERKWLYYVFVVALVYVISYFHQLTVFALLYTVLFTMLWNKAYRDSQQLITLGITVVWFFIRIFLLKSTSYESEKIPTLQVFLEQLPHLKSLPSTQYFKEFFKHEFLLVFAVYSISLAYFAFRKRYLFMLFNGLFFIGFLSLILITYYKGESPLMYENYYVLLGFIWGLPIVFLLFELNNHWLFFSTSLILIGYSLFGIFQSHHVFTKKIEYLERLVNQAQHTPAKKFLVHQSNFNWRVSWVSWSLPFETALLSSDITNAQNATFYMASDYSKFDTILQKENIFLGPDWAPTWFGSQNLNHHYYSFPSTGYVKLNSSQADSSFDVNHFTKENVSIEAVKKHVVSDADAFVVVPVKITNQSGHTIASIPDCSNQTFLSYHIYDEAGKVVDSDGYRSALEADVHQELVTGLIIELPAKGKYKVAIDMVTENVKWWDISDEITLEVK